MRKKSDAEDFSVYREAFSSLCADFFLKKVGLPHCIEAFGVLREENGEKKSDAEDFSVCSEAFNVLCDVFFLKKVGLPHCIEALGAFFMRRYLSKQSLYVPPEAEQSRA